MSNYDSWDFEPAPAPSHDSWDTWDTGPGLDLPPPEPSYGGGGSYGSKGYNDFSSKGSWNGGNDSWNGGKNSGYGKGSPDFGKGDFGKGGYQDFGKGKNDWDSGKGYGKDFSKGFGGGKGKDFGSKGMDNNFGGKGDFGKGDFGKGDFGKGGSGFGSLVPPPPQKGMNKGPMMVSPPGAAAKGVPTPAGQLVAPPQGNMIQVQVPPMKGFNGGKGNFIPAPPGFSPGQPPPPPFGSAPPPPMPLMPQSQSKFASLANLGPPGVPAPQGMMNFGPQGMMQPELLALTEVENIAPPMDDGTGVKATGGDKKPRLMLLLTRLAPELKDEHMQQILDQCGEVQAWRRARDPSDRSLSFGFAQFSDPEAAWKASTCLSKLVLCGQELKVLLEETTESLIAQWRTAQQAALKVNSAEELEWELERKSVSCKSLVDQKVEELYGQAKGGVAASKRREELRKKEQARILRVRKRKAWREAEFAKELERVESLEKRLRRSEKETDGLDRKKEQLAEAKDKEDGDHKSMKKEEAGEAGGPLEPVAVVNEQRALAELVDRIQSESRVNLFKMDLDVTYLRNEKTFEKKLRPWLERKIDLFMGGPQSDLVEYVLRRVNATINAEALVSDLQRYLDDNAEPLVERMWRMLIFELMRSGQTMGGRMR